MHKLIKLGMRAAVICESAVQSHTHRARLGRGRGRNLTWHHVWNQYARFFNNGDRADASKQAMANHSK